MRFHLPAFMTTELLFPKTSTDSALFTLTNVFSQWQVARFSLLDAVQRQAVIHFLEYYAAQPDYEFERASIERALLEFWS
jgi:hypothetical protein